MSSQKNCFHKVKVGVDMEPKGLDDSKGDALMLEEKLNFVQPHLEGQTVTGDSGRNLMKELISHFGIDQD